MKNALNSVKVSAPSTNAFNLSHDVKLSCKMGDLIPVAVLECLPGDRWRLGCENLIRLAPMLAPMMHRVDVRVEYFFVPCRLLWENYETWITNGGDDSPQTNPLPAFPRLQYNDGTLGWVDYAMFPLLDYMGLPDPQQCPDPTYPERISAMPFAAYQKIWQDYYRDENLQGKPFPDENFLADGDNSGTSQLFTMRKRAWEADYFTKALPFAQKGEPVDVPLGTVQLAPLGTTPTDAGRVLNASDHLVTGGALNAAALTGTLTASTGPTVDSVYDPNGTLLVGPTTINDLRLAYRLQEWLEKNARGGTRYSETIRAHYNVRPEDARLQRAEYIVGVKNPIQISEVLNTTGTDDAPQGTMAGHGVSYSKGNYGKYFCHEHGYIIGLLSIMPKTSYQQGIPKHFLKYTDPTEIAWPTFANLGEQAIQNREVMAFRGAAPVIGSQGTFGYTPRYMEYKTEFNRVCGEFRTTLDFWTMTRIFDPMTPPVLNSAFIEADPTKRIFAVEAPEVDDLYCQVMHHITCVRALPFYGTPTF